VPKAPVSLLGEEAEVMSAFAPSPWHRSWLSTQLSRSSSLPPQSAAKSTDRYHPLATWKEKQGVIRAKVNKGLKDDADAKREHRKWLEEFLGAKDADGTVGFNDGRKFRTFDEGAWDTLHPVQWKALTEGLLQRLDNELRWKQLSKERRDNMRQQALDYLNSLVELDHRLENDSSAGCVDLSGVVKTRYGPRIHTKKVRDELQEYNRDKTGFVQTYRPDKSGPNKEYNFVDDYEKNPTETVMQMQMEDHVRRYRQHMFGSEMRERGRGYQDRMEKVYKALRAKFEGDIIMKQIPYREGKKKVDEYIAVETLDSQPVKDSRKRQKEAESRANTGKEQMLDRMKAYGAHLRKIDFDLEKSAECGFIKGGEKLVQTIYRSPEDKTPIKRSLRHIGPPFFQSVEDKKNHARKLMDNTAEMYRIQRETRENLEKHMAACEADNEAACVGGAYVEGFPERLVVEQKIVTPHVEATPLRLRDHNTRSRARKSFMEEQTRSHLKHMQDLRDLPFEEHMAMERKKHEFEDFF
jgi:hypothetical protein